ncbi:PTR2-domain-containing protein [Microthyrium microscopicum]|uniref:PTR2-domain-containing protein n=1 Tax=Microthyrium microscopicum TaxID=703497 RepID=A0A6A6UCB6_9PEZI|nr:PTR2-domain-containing protein [Microthyrium microscopicum]
MATATVIGDAVASRPPPHVVEKHARNSLIIGEKEQILEDSTKISSSGGSDGHVNHPIPIAHLPGSIPTEEEARTLRKISGRVPWIAFILCVVEFAERASYYGASQVFSNFMQWPLPREGNGAGAPARNPSNPIFKEDAPGGLGKGFQYSNSLTLVFRFLAYTIPILGAWIGDAKLGRYRTVMIGVLICGISHIVQIFGALPSVLQKGQGEAPFVVSLILLAIGAGLFKPNILPIVLDQYETHEDYVSTLKSGERVIISSELTMNRIALMFYCFVNVGAFVGLATAYAEKFVGFWLAFLIPGVIYFMLPLVLIFAKKHTKLTQPDASELDNFFKVVGIALKHNKGKFWGKAGLDVAKPTNLAAMGITTYRKKPITWDDKFVDDVKRTVRACVMFLWFPVWYLNDGGNVANSQGATMTKGSAASNDVIQNFNPLTLIWFVPLLTYVIYPNLERWNLMPGRISRITFGFTLAWISSVVAAILQWQVYQTNPCGYYVTTCKKGVSTISVWAQAPIYILGAMSECFCQVTAYEIAYARSPKNMKSLVMSIFMFMNALSSALGLIVTPAIKDPGLIWVWIGPAITMFVISIFFRIQYHSMNSDDFILKEDDIVDQQTTQTNSEKPPRV